MKELHFPIKFKFKISSLANDFTATDANDNTIAYVRQKMFKLKEAITVYTDESKSSVLYTIAADKWIDFSAAYSFTTSDGVELGKIARKGWASLWKAKYELIDQNQKLQYQVREENGWVKVMDSLVGEIPILNFFTGILFNPAYKVINKEGETIARIVKDKSMWGRKFTVSKVKEFDQDDGERIILGLMMMILLERRRG